MREYLAEMKHICDNLAGCGQKISDEEQQSAILNGLPRSLKIFPFGVQSRFSVPMYSNGSSDGAYRSSRPMTRGYYRDGRRKGRFSGTNRQQCRLCGRVGHLVNRCFY
ncbi:hypothetical protein Godav_029790 [Gossypium davidsonii]|uniref:CCHC-type domain-containing protein n=1 Tax=Gossypium davidsonii TaxID=34287 RepID=A0A7J8TAU6_GOSDV|nr:hypothetical protein [Gossypium davidsonii]